MKLELAPDIINALSDVILDKLLTNSQDSEHNNGNRRYPNTMKPISVTELHADIMTTINLQFTR